MTHVSCSRSLVCIVPLGCIYAYLYAYMRPEFAHKQRGPKSLTQAPPPEDKREVLEGGKDHKVKEANL